MDMIHDTIAALAAALKPRERLLGLDVGSKTIGLAVSDSDLRVATSIQTLARGKFTKDAETLAKMIAERTIGGLVIGLPVSMDGTEGPACQSVRQFGANLDSCLNVNMNVGIAFWDERLSTSAVQRFLTDEIDMSRKRRAEVVDKMAAAYILQGALDSLRR
jgi:putative Holliday junction resolvase